MSHVLRDGFFEERGGVMIEFVLIIPLLIFFLYAIVEYGRLFRENVWLGQTTYNTLVAGAENLPDDADLFMPTLIDRLYLLQNRVYKATTLSQGACNAGQHFRCGRDMTSVLVDPVTNVATTIAARLLRIEVASGLNSVLHEFFLSARVGLSGPILVGDAIDPLLFNDFANPGTLRNCDGTGPNTSPQSNCCGVDHLTTVSGDQDPAGGMGLSVQCAL